jgi:hypothetical protein
MDRKTAKENMPQTMFQPRQQKMWNQVVHQKCQPEIAYRLTIDKVAHGVRPWDKWRWLL